MKDQIHRTLCGIWYPPHLYLIRRAAADRLQEAQAWLPGRKVATDVEYSAMAALMGLRFLYVPGAHVTYNIWSNSQISGRTPYRERASSLVAIFARLRGLADAAPAGVSITQRHRTLLDQSWTVWTLPKGTASIVRVEGRRARLRHHATGRTLELRPREAVIANAMLLSRKALTGCHFGLMLSEMTPPVVDDPVLVVETIDKLSRAGFLVAVGESDGSANP